MFKLVPFEELDKVKWNSCIHYASNGNVFGYHWFLKNTIKEWDSLVYNDYEMVMALPKLNKQQERVDVINTPKYLRELGLYSLSFISKSQMNQLINAFPGDLKINRVAFNLGNPIDSVLENHTLQQHTNSTVSLYPSYEDIRSNYSGKIPSYSSLQENNWFLDNQIKVEELVEFIFSQTQLDWDTYTALRIIYNALHRGIGLISVLKNKQHEILAAGFFIYSHGRIVHLFSTAHGKNQDEKLFYLFDGLIQSHAKRPLLLDLNMPKNDFTKAIGAIFYSYPVMLNKNSKNNWVDAVLAYFQ